MSFLQNIRPDRIPPFLAPKDDLHLQREIILQHVLNTLLLFAVASSTFWLYQTGWQINQPQMWLRAGLIVVLSMLTFIRRLPFNLRAILVLTMLGALGVFDLFRNGISGSGVVFLLTFGIIGGSFFGTRRGIITLLIAWISLMLTGWLIVNRHIQVPAEVYLVGAAEADLWVYDIIATIFSGILLAGAVFQFTEGLANTLKNFRELARNLEQERSQLDIRVQQRTAELTRKTAQLEAARKVAAYIAAQTDIQSLLTTAVNVIREQFDFYHAGIFLPDDKNEYALLKAATGEAGRIMLETGHRLKIGQVGIVGYVMSSGEPRISGNVAEDPAHYVNPILPDTHSEMAVPMKLAGQIVGVVDVQSTRRNAFSSDDVDVLMTIADQLSAGLEKARLLDQYQKDVEDLKQSAQQQTQINWRQHLRNSRKRYAYRYRQEQVEAIPPGQEDLELTLWKEAQVSSETDGKASSIQMPIKLRDQTIGVVNLKLSTSRVTNEMVDLVENAIERMSVSLETVRLMEEIQTRSERERMVGDIASKVRAATDIETILRTTADELGRSLGVSEVLVQLAPRE